MYRGRIAATKAAAPPTISCTAVRPTGFIGVPVVRVPIDPISSGVDHFIHGMGIDIRTSGSSAHMAITYYYYPVSACGSNCQLFAGFTLSNDGGQTWTAGRQLSGAMQLSWLPQHLLRQNGGRLCGDGVSGGRQGFPDLCHRACSRREASSTRPSTPRVMVSPADEMTEPRMSSKDDKPIPGAKSDHPARTPEDRDNELPGKTPPIR